MTIVCATHFSDSSFNAVRAAAELARKHKQPLWLVRVLPNVTLSPRAREADIASRDALQLEVRALATEGIEAHLAVLHGALDRAVGRFCTEKSAQLLVVGASSHQLSPVLAGSLDKLVYGIDIPVLVVRDPRPFQAWATGQTSLKVMLALDHTWASALARDWIQQLAKFGSLDLVAAHIWFPKDEYARRNLSPPADETHAELAKTMLRETEAALFGLPANVKHRVHLEIDRGHIAEHLLELANTEQVDVFVLGTHPTRGPLSKLWSVSHDILSDAPMSVAVIPGPPVSAPTPTFYESKAGAPG